MFRTYIFTITILAIPIFSNASVIRYFCPSPQDFKNSGHTLTAKTYYNHLKYTWIAKDTTPSSFQESPITFKGAALTNCKDNICDLTCYYYSNIENHVVISTMKSSPHIQINQHPNMYLRNFSCQYTEHVDCPFIVNVL